MRLHSAQRLWLVALAKASFDTTQHVATGLETMAPPQCAGGTHITTTVPVTDCQGLEALPVPMTENVNLFVDGVETIACESLVTVRVGGRHELRLTSNGPALKLNNVRFVVEDGATLSVDLGHAEATRATSTATADGGDAAATGGVTADGVPAARSGSTPLTLEGVTQQSSNGGVLEVKKGGLAVFLVPVHFEANSVANGYSGGAVHVDGSVAFEHAAHFVGNRAFGEEFLGEKGACGGAVSVGQGGRVVFSKFVSFEENFSERGGALCNRGFAAFLRRSFFNGNSASGGGISIGGDGGAVYADDGSKTVFTRRSTMLTNSARGSGGALFNAGSTTFETSAEFQGNEATGVPRETEASQTGGGHVFNRGMLKVKGDVSFREGSSGTDGGAVFTLAGERTVLSGITTLDGNMANGLCDEIFSVAGGIKLTTTSTLPAVTSRARQQRRTASTAPLGLSPCLP